MLPKDKLWTVQPMVSHAGRQFEAREERALYALASPAASTLPGQKEALYSSLRCLVRLVSQTLLRLLEVIIGWNGEYLVAFLRS